MNIQKHIQEHFALGLPNSSLEQVNTVVAAVSNKSLLVIGADHTSIQHYGSANNGLSKMYADLNLPHYIAINTDHGSNGDPGGDANQMTWDQIKILRDTNGADIISHAARHINNWERLNTGIALLYTGAGSAATVSVSGTYPAITIASLVTAGPGGEAWSFDTSNALYNTFAELKAAIEATGTGVWTCTLAPELPDTYPANLLLTIAAQDVRTAARRYCAGGGITVRYVATGVEATDAKTATYTVASGTITFYQDGVQVATYALASYTLATLSTAIDALAGWDSAVCSDTPTGEASYCSGTESAANIANFIGARDCLSQPTPITAGLPNWEMADLQMQRAIDVAAAQSVTLTDFAQPGGAFHRWHTWGHAQHSNFRGNLDERATIAPLAIPSHRAGNYLLQWNPDTSYTQAQVAAAITALASAPGWTSCILMHNVAYDGTTGYSLNYTGYTADQDESDWFATLGTISALMTAGSLSVLNMDNAIATAALQKPPRNLLFNPGFINSGEVITGLTSDGGKRVPGWLVNTTTGLSAASIVDGKLILTGSGASNSALRQQIYVQPGKTYEFGVMVYFPTSITGTGAFIQLQKLRGDWKGQRVTDTTASISTITRTEHVKLRFTVPNRALPKPRIRSLVTVGPTFDLSTNMNIQINIMSIGAIDNLNCATGAASAAAVTVYEVAAAINAGIKASATYRDYPEYHNIARGENGRVILELPTIESESSFVVRLQAASVTSATALIFGNANCQGQSLPQQHAGIEDYVMYLNIGTVLTGEVQFYDPYLKEVQYE